VHANLIRRGSRRGRYAPPIGAAGIDARSLAKQTGPLHLDIETLILTYRYASAVKSGSVGEALRAGAKLVATRKLVANVPPDAEGNHRVVLEALEVANHSELLAEASLGYSTGSLLPDERGELASDVRLALVTDRLIASAPPLRTLLQVARNFDVDLISQSIVAPAFGRCRRDHPPTTRILLPSTPTSHDG
jgi:hypothetical protein